MIKIVLCSAGISRDYFFITQKKVEYKNKNIKINENGILCIIVPQLVFQGKYL